MAWSRFLLKPLGPFLWQRVASRRVASNGCRARDEGDEDRQETRHKDHHQHSNQDQLGLRVAKIQGPPDAEALWDKQSRIVGIVVKDTCIPVLIIIAENGVGVPAISGCARFCPGTLRMPEQGEDEGDQQSTHQREKEPYVHRCSTFKGERH
jgi:hypothetical protein